MKKLVVLGCPGSGKSHLARKLHEKTGLPLYPLDRLEGVTGMENDAYKR